MEQPKNRNLADQWLSKACNDLHEAKNAMLEDEDPGVRVLGHVVSSLSSTLFQIKESIRFWRAA